MGCGPGQAGEGRGQARAHLWVEGCAGVGASKDPKAKEQDESRDWR